MIFQVVWHCCSMRHATNEHQISMAQLHATNQHQIAMAQLQLRVAPPVQIPHVQVQQRK